MNTQDVALRIMQNKKAHTLTYECAGGRQEDDHFTFLVLLTSFSILHCQLRFFNCNVRKSYFFRTLHPFK